MTSPVYNRATHFGIVWAVTLAIITLVEWHGLDRDPVRQEIFSPFIERTMAVSVEDSAAPAGESADPIAQAESADAVLRYDVEITFNGPLFLACFFAPMLLFQGIGVLWNRYRGN